MKGAPSCLVPALLALMALLLGACAATRPYRGNGDWEAERPRLAAVVVMPPRVAAGHVDAEGRYQVRDSLAGTARVHLEQALVRLLRSKLPHASVAVFDATGRDPAALAAALAVFERVNRAVVGYTYLPGARRALPEEPGLGPALRPLALPAGAAVFAWADDYTVSDAYVARQAAGSLLEAALGTSGRRVSDETPAGAFARGVSLAVVRVSDGALLWFNYVPYDRSMNLTGAASAAEVVQAVGAWL